MHAMINYDAIKTHCSRINQLSSDVIDDFLIPYAAQQDNLEREAKKQLARYRHVQSDLPQSWSNMIVSQYIAHKIFEEGGLIHRYINHSALNHMRDKELEYLKEQATRPWRFSFAIIADRPARDFFEMVDVFTGESYLLYSTGLTKYMSSQNVVLCFNLIGYNGKCWQTFGPISAYESFEPTDIEFFATQLNRGYWFEDTEELTEFIESKPIPFTYLFAGSKIPMVIHDDHQIVQITAEYIDDTFNADALRNQFTVEYSNGVYKISEPEWSKFPHFTSAYYDEKEELLFLNALTDAGFQNLVDNLNLCGYNLSAVPDFRVNMSMLQFSKRLLKKEINLNPYDDNFTVPLPEKESKNTQNINALMSELIPFINSGQQPDFNQLSKRFDVPVEDVEGLYHQVRGKLDF